MDYEGFGKHAALFKPLERPGWRFYLVVAVLALIVVTGVGAYIVQLVCGLGVTGLNRPVFWGFYIINTIFFIAISYGGTLTSAILRLVNARWRLPITRAAEVITVCALGIGAFNIVLDMGRPDRVLNMILYGRLQLLVSAADPRHRHPAGQIPESQAALPVFGPGLHGHRSPEAPPRAGY
jgi:Ni/Fe-hydrogenase subunit HybB-like protein